jgi:hypothetical protein
MQGKIDEEKEAKQVLTKVEPEGIHQIALAKWKEL